MQGAGRTGSEESREVGSGPRWQDRKGRWHGHGNLFLPKAGCFGDRVETSAPSALWIVLAALASLVAVLQTVRLLWHRLSRTWAIRTRARRAVEGEARAETILRDAGYEVLERQVRGGWTVYADGEPLEIGLRADLLVARGGRRYVAEVKTGKLAPRLDHAATRRQLLEYRVAFGVEGVLLVDAEAGRVTVVELGVGDEAGGDARRPGLAVWSAVFAAGLVIGVVLEWSRHR